MVSITVTANCPHCNAANIYENSGKDSARISKFACIHCGEDFQLTAHAAMLKPVEVFDSL